MSQYKHNEGGDLAGDILGLLLRGFVFVLVGAWIVCQWLTRLLFELLINPLLDGALDRHDGLVVALSAGLWAAVALLLFPFAFASEIEGAPPEEIRQALLAVGGFGLAWGTSIGFWILLTWWSAVELAPAYEPVQLLGEPIEVAARPPADAQKRLPPPSLPSCEELEADLEEVLGREEAWQGV